MHRCRCLILAAIGATTPGLAAEPIALEGFGFAQLTAESIDDDVEFGADRIRVGARLARDRLTAGIQLDFNAGDLSARPPGTLSNVIKDVYVGYRFHDLASVKLGQFKTPIGMDFALPGYGLDITKRGMERGLVLERDLGLMLSGHALDGRLSYDAGLFNPAGRSAATAHVGSGPDDQVGEDHAWAARIAYELSPQWHAEFSLGESENAGGPATEDYEVFDLGLRYSNAPWTFKAEYIRGEHVLGLPDRDEEVWYAHGGYRLDARTELVLRHYAGRSDAGGVATDLSNTYAGVSYLLHAEDAIQARLQANYVYAGGDRATYTGVSGFRDNAILIQLQVGYLP